MNPLTRALGFGFGFVFTISVASANWPAWRGDAMGTGVAPDSALPLKWSATENVKWKTPLPEAGNSTPIVWGDRVFVTQASGARRLVMAFDRRNGCLLYTSDAADE